MIIRCYFFAFTAGKRVLLHDHQMPFLHADKQKNSSLTWSPDVIFSPSQLEKQLPYTIIICHFLTLTTGKILLLWSLGVIVLPWLLEKKFSYLINRYHFFTLTTRKIVLSWSSDVIFSPSQLEKEFPYLIIRCHFFTLTNRKIVPLHDHEMPLFHHDNWKNSFVTWWSGAVVLLWHLEK